MILINGNWEKASKLADCISIVREQLSPELAEQLEKLTTPSAEEKISDLITEMNDMITELNNLKGRVESTAFSLGEI